MVNSRGEIAKRFIFYIGLRGGRPTCRRYTCDDIQRLRTRTDPQFDDMEAFCLDFAATRERSRQRKSRGTAARILKVIQPEQHFLVVWSLEWHIGRDCAGCAAERGRRCIVYLPYPRLNVIQKVVVYPRRSTIHKRTCWSIWSCHEFLLFFRF